MPLEFLDPGVKSPIQMYYSEIFRKLKLFSTVPSSEVHLEVTTEHQYMSLAQTHAQCVSSQFVFQKSKKTHTR